MFWYSKSVSIVILVPLFSNTFQFYFLMYSLLSTLFGLFLFSINICLKNILQFFTHLACFVVCFPIIFLFFNFFLNIVVLKLILFLLIDINLKLLHFSFILHLIFSIFKIGFPFNAYSWVIFLCFFCLLIIIIFFCGQSLLHSNVNKCFVYFNHYYSCIFNSCYYFWFFGGVFIFFKLAI